MKYLLDTHTLLWVLFEDEKLSEKAKIAIKNPNNEIYVSIVTYWEISLKYALGKLELEGITPEELPKKAEEIGIETLEVTEEEASTFYKLPRIKHKDPFDTFIIWQAINRKIVLISKDKPRSFAKPLFLEIPEALSIDPPLKTVLARSFYSLLLIKLNHPAY